mgnify:CR=1 FL=1
MKHLQSDKDSRQMAGQQPEGQRYPIVLTRDLVKYYGSGENLVRAIDHTSLDLQRGEFTAIVGRSGSGKSTLLHMLGGLDRPDSGKVLIEGQEIPPAENRIHFPGLQSGSFPECMGKYRTAHRT